MNALLLYEFSLSHLIFPRMLLIEHALIMISVVLTTLNLSLVPLKEIIVNAIVNLSKLRRKGSDSQLPILNSYFLVVSVAAPIAKHM